jgi:hypothetical protein
MKRFLWLWLLVPAAAVCAQGVEQDLERAKLFTFAKVVSSGRYAEELEIVPDQHARISERTKAHKKRYRELLAMSMGVEPGTPLVGDLEDFLPHAEQQKAWVGDLEAARQAFDLELRAELLPSQIEAVEGIVLRERYRIGGVRAVIASNDIAAVRDLALPLGVADRFAQADQKAQSEIDKLEEELQAIMVKYREKADQIRQRETDAAMTDLGVDAERLQKLIEATK